MMVEQTTWDSLPGVLNIKKFLFILLALHIHPLESALVMSTSADLVTTDLLLSNTDFLYIKAIVY